MTRTSATPPIIDRGRLRSGLRSSSVKYSALCQPPYVIATDCSATTMPANVAVGAWSAIVDADPGDAARQSTTSKRKATNFTAVVTSWKRLPTRTPAHCSATKLKSAPTAIAFTAPPSDGMSSAENSPIAIETYPSTAQ